MIRGCFTSLVGLVVIAIVVVVAGGALLHWAHSHASTAEHEATTSSLQWAEHESRSTLCTAANQAAAALGRGVTIDGHHFSAGNLSSLCKG
jgi:hypothetical protein